MFKELYFWMYTYLIKIRKSGNIAESAYLLISSLQMMNFGTVYVVVHHYLGYSFGIENIDNIYCGIALAVIFYIINRKFLYSKHNEIAQKYTSLSIKRQRTGKICFWLYVLLSHVLLYYSVSKLVIPRY